ncbi:serine carboxypeptidase [Cytidiella melzeri]|nr:serine carboxypeptidase [Cytidiella melzeri]
MKWLQSVAWAFCLFVSTVRVIASESQKPLVFHDTTVSSRIVTSDSLSNLYTEFTTLQHPAFPRYTVRVKKTKFCDATVGGYTGYIDIEARHLFFYFFESRRNSTEDDVILWTNGCSGASMGLFMEIGPCKVASSGDELVNNPWAWNELANIIFLDQPIGTGFSYADHGEFVSTTEEAAKDIAAFVAIFFEHFSQLRGNKFHLAGESYGGRYLPIFGSEIHVGNAQLIAAGMTPINLSSIILGRNPCSDMQNMLPSYYEVQCQHMTFRPITAISSCVAMKRALPRCKQWLREGCYNHRDHIDCEAAVAFCESILMDPFKDTGRNPYDLSKNCEGPYVETLCYPVTKKIGKYLEKPEVRKQIGVDPSLSANFTGCSWDLRTRFRITHDHYNPTQYYLGALLDRGVRVLVYVGENDWICNWVANERTSLELEWHGQARFAKEPLRPWTHREHVAGKTRSAGALTFATVIGAGHMAPYDKPEETLEILRRWLAGKPL